MRFWMIELVFNIVFDSFLDIHLNIESYIIEMAFNPLPLAYLGISLVDIESLIIYS